MMTVDWSIQSWSKAGLLATASAAHRSMIGCRTLSQHAWFLFDAILFDDNIKSLLPGWLSVAVVAAVVVVFPRHCRFCCILPSTIVMIDCCVVSVMGIVSSSYFQ
jgi:hypothetical protein